MSNSGLNAAKAKKYDEFYTRRQDIEAELRFYRDEFAGKPSTAIVMTLGSLSSFSISAAIFVNWG